MKLKLKPYQDSFLFSKKRFPALVAGIGTGKTMMLLMKIWRFCEAYPNSLALIVRKEYTDLHDSTIKDFENYFLAKVDSHKEYHFKNGSTIMFRHGSELNVLKNINLSIVGIEQAEEFEVEETFTFLRDRLRRDNAPYRQLCLIANASGHNWIWRFWKNNPPSEQYHLEEATTFDNEDNLPADFIQDLKQMEQEAPSHYKRYVLNDWEEISQDDYVFTWTEIKQAIGIEFKVANNASKRILGVDVARFGKDETVFTILESKGNFQWEQTYIETHREKDLMWTVGRIIDMRREHRIDIVVVDDDGLGGGVSDRLKELGIGLRPFRGQERPNKSDLYANKRTEGYFTLKSYINNGYLKPLDNHSQTDQLLTIKYKYTSKGQKMLISKDAMRKEGIKSPDIADALMMAGCYITKAVRREFNPQPQKVY